MSIRVYKDGRVTDQKLRDVEPAFKAKALSLRTELIERCNGSA